MNEEFDLPIESTEISSAVKRHSLILRKLSWLNIWVQGILVVIASGMTLFAVGRNLLPQGPNAVGRAVGLAESSILLILSIIVQLFLMFRSYQCVKTGRRLRQSNPETRPKKIDTIDFLWWNVLFTMAGLGLAILAAQAIGGILLGRSASAMGAMMTFQPVNWLNPLDFFLVLANTHIISAHAIGLAITLWILKHLDR